MSSALPATEAPAHAGVRGGALTVFLAALGPMLTVPALRRLLMDGHGASPAGVHAFVAAGMIGAAIGAPLVARRADRRSDHLHVAMILAAVDALVAVVTSTPALPTTLLFALRPVHGLASMGLLALLFAELRRTSKRLVAHGGAAMVAALAIGPAVGGVLTHTSPEAPFRAAALVSALVAVLIASGARPLEQLVTVPAPAPRAPLAGPLRALFAPLCVVMTQRFAIGGLVASFAVQARAVHGLSDARIGASFSVLLSVFAVGVFVLGRRFTAVRLAQGLPVGALLSGGAFVALAVAPSQLLPLALVAAGLGCALVYTPCLALVASASTEGPRATSIALLHSAGAVGMILGPIVAAIVEIALEGLSAAERGAVFMVTAAICHVGVTFLLTPRCRAIVATSSTQPRIFEESNDCTLPTTASRVERTHVGASPR